MASQSLQQLRELTTRLCKRDEGRTAELELYDAFFSNIPLRTFVWTVDAKMNILVKNRKSLCSTSALISNGTLNDAFSCSAMNEYNIKMHQDAFTGEAQTYLSYENKACFLTTLIPDMTSDGDVLHVHGCSWEVTHLQKIIQCSNEAIAALEGSNSSLANKIANVFDEAPLIQLIIRLNEDSIDG